MIDLNEFMRINIKILIREALHLSFTNPRELFFLLKFAARNSKAYRIRLEKERQGEHIPPFLIASITTNCNLFCKGCYARENNPCAGGETKKLLSAERWKELFVEAESLGIGFILLAGGEPLLRKEILEKAAEVSGVIFPVFTNGTLIDRAYAKLFDRHRNLLPVLSLEGNQEMTDARRGAGTFEKLNAAMNELNAKKILYGISVTVTTENMEFVTGWEFVQNVTRAGCKILFYIEYVPVDETTQELALDGESRQIFDRNLDGLRSKSKKLLFIAFPGDEKLSGGCLAAGRGFFHINADGDAEPCPFSPYSDSNVRKNSLLEAMKSPLFHELRKEEYLL